MKGRDKNGRFVKNELDGLNFALPSLKQLIYWLLILVILSPWIVIGIKLNIPEKYSMLFDYLLDNKEVSEGQKKWIILLGCLLIKYLIN